MTEQAEITVIDMREAGREELLDLSRSLLEVSENLRLQGLQLRVVRRITPHDPLFCRLVASDFFQNL